MGEQLPDLQLDQLHELGSSTMSTLFREDHHAGRPTCGRGGCARGLGHRPLGAATTRIAPSIWAAPVIMF